MTVHMKSALRMQSVLCKDRDICYVLPVLSMSWLYDAKAVPSREDCEDSGGAGLRETDNSGLLRTEEVCGMHSVQLS